MKHLIEAEDLSGLTRVDYNRIILDSDTDDIIVRRGGEGNPNGYPYVDLGLPSGLKWATMNVGATSETEKGDYFMWGSTTANTAKECTWTNAPFNGGASSCDEAYFTDHKSKWLDDNDNLKPEYDAARVNMGGDWRMPTEAEFQELLDKTTHEWTTINGVKGRKFTSKTDTSKYIFIPAAGDFYYGSSYNVGGVHIWGSSKISSIEYASCLTSDSSSYYMSVAPRCRGLSVRGVL